MGSAVIAAGRYVEIRPDEGLRLVGEAIARSVRAGHWLGQGPSDDHLIEIADNLSRARHLIERDGRPSGPATANRQAVTPDIHGQLVHTLYVAAHGTAVALGGYVAELQHRLEVGTRRRQPMAERPTTLEITEAQGMISRFSGFEQLAAAYMFGQPLPSADPGQRRVAAQATRLETALAAWEVQAHRTLAANPDPADLVRIARVQALITSTTSVISEAAAKRGQIDDGVMQRLGSALEASQVAWSRSAKRWGELTNPASRTDPALVGAASELLSAIAAAATNRDGWATADQLATRVNLPAAVRSLHLSMVASIDIAYVVRDTAADHPGLTGPAGIIGMRSQGEAEIAIEQGETRRRHLDHAPRDRCQSTDPVARAGQTRTDQPRRRGHRHHKPGCRRGRPSRPRQPHANDENGSSNEPRTLLRVPSDHRATKSSAKRTTPVRSPPTPQRLREG
jgi:hypothetical protein